MIMPGIDGVKLTVPVEDLLPGDYIPRSGWIRRIKVNRKGSHVLVYYNSNKATGFPIGDVITITRRERNELDNECSK